MTLRRRSRKQGNKSTKPCFLFAFSLNFHLFFVSLKIKEIKVCFLNVVYLLLPLTRFKKKSMLKVGVFGLN